MIELRWFKKEVGINLDGPGLEYIRLLQYRQRSFSEIVIPGLGGYGEWSEWKEVPTVMEVK